MSQRQTEYNGDFGVFPELHQLCNYADILAQNQRPPGDRVAKTKDVFV